MKLYLLTQEINTGCCCFNGAVVVADNEEEAKTIAPYTDFDNKEILYQVNENGKWCFCYGKGAEPKDIKVTYLGEADPGLKKGSVIVSDGPD